ncbi:hypothetical protein FQR65_LT01098 [Abscondita terminalis]|nr:hypothetical protein FQR65_LT01098 [Abscondita terminalis]
MSLHMIFLIVKILIICVLLDAQSNSNFNFNNANFEMATVDYSNRKTKRSNEESQKTDESEKSNKEHEIEEIEYENELRAISEILGIKFTDANDQTLESLKTRLAEIIDEVKQDKQNDNAKEKNDLIVYLEGTLYTLRNVTGSEALHNLKVLRHQLETVSHSITDKITSILERFTPKFNLFGDTLAESLGKFADNFSRLLNTLKSESKKMQEQSSTTKSSKS